MDRSEERHGRPRIRRRTRIAAALALVALGASAPAAVAADETGHAAGRPSTNPPGQRLLSDEITTTRWAHAYTRAKVRHRPTRSARSFRRLHLLTEDDFPEVYVVLSTWRRHGGITWAKIRIPGRPNGRTGWVARSALGDLRLVRTLIVVDRRKLRLTLLRSGRRVFSARVGIGKRGTPTPSGRFWVREKFRVQGSPVYGTHAIGTSAYAPTLSDWPGGGVVGLHGTNQPGLIPGRPSHGCIRLRNADIGRLYRLVPRGTPIRIY
jgi:lipoprotein-anchoring transpeptidase ErfK/SrfK